MNPKEETAPTPAWRLKFSQSNKQQQQKTKQKKKTKSCFYKGTCYPDAAYI